MQYNIHPIVVHFPIALLFIYSLVTVLPVDKWIPSVAWRQIRAFLLVFGFLGALVALSTGELADELTAPNRDLVQAHSLFANISAWIYGILLAGEVVYFFKTQYASLPVFSSLSFQRIFNIIQKILLNSLIIKALAVLGFFAILLTGMLGGVMVYGTTADPLAIPVLRLLGISI